MNALFLHLLQDTFARHAARPALIHAGRKWTYADLELLVRRAAVNLQAAPIFKGDRVALCTSNKVPFLIAHLATLFAGGVSLPLNPRFTREELQFFLHDSEARVAVVETDAWDVVESLRPQLANLQSILADPGIFEAPEELYRPPPVTADDACLMLYSSGTTGWPKGVVHTHGNVASSLLALQKCWHFTPDDVVLNVLPLFHIHGLCFAALLTLMSGGCLVLDDFEPQRTMERIKDVTVFMAVPTIYYRFLEQPAFRESAATWQKTRLFTCGSAPIRAEVLPELEAVLGKPVINRYGMTEAFVITSLPLEGSWPHGSVGLPVDGIEVRVEAPADRSVCPTGEVRIGAPADRSVCPTGEVRIEAPADRSVCPTGEVRVEAPADRSVCPTGEVGAVQLRGPNLFREYWNKPDATREAFASGWFDSGDLGFLDAAGHLTLVGRKNDLIITSGFNVYPQIVERVINDCPGVRESAVVGVPDERKGERVVAVVVRADPTLDEERLRAFWSERLVDYQRPREIVFVESLPRNAMGKVLRRELQTMMGAKP